MAATMNRDLKAQDRTLRFRDLNSGRVFADHRRPARASVAEFQTELE
jgi:hypothetical protein